VIRTSVSFSVSGNVYEDLLDKAKKSLSEFFDIPVEEVEKRINIEINVTDQTESLEFDEDDYIANVIAQVKNV
jgi:hypothetical protein